MVMQVMVEPLNTLKEQQLSWNSPSRAHAAMAFTATIIMNIRWESTVNSGSGIHKDIMVQNDVHGLFSILVGEEVIGVSRHCGKVDWDSHLMESKNGSTNAQAPHGPAKTVNTGPDTSFIEENMVSARRFHRRFVRRGYRGYRATSKLAALALLPLLPMDETKRFCLGHIPSQFPGLPDTFVCQQPSLPSVPDSAVSNSPHQEQEKGKSHLLCELSTAALVGALLIGMGKTKYGRGAMLAPFVVVFSVSQSGASEPPSAKIRLDSGSQTSPTSYLKGSSDVSSSLLTARRDVRNLSGMQIGDTFVHTSGKAEQTASSRPPRLTADSAARPAGRHSRRKNWASHVSTAYTVRKYQVIAIWCGVLLAACLIYWLFLREHIPPAWAASFCLLIFVIGFLYNSETSNVVNELLTFVSGMTVFGVLRVLSHRKVLHRCQCRLCEREMSIVSKLGEGSFGAVYTARTTHRASEGAGVTCVVKRVPVDLDKDINDASEALQEAKSLLKLEAHPHIVAYMDVWLHRDNPASPFKPPVTEVCLMMEFCGGGDLFDRLETERARPGGVPERSLMAWAAQIADGVAFIHSKGITHCDLKLENIFLTDRDTAKIGDFGLSLQLKRRSSPPAACEKPVAGRDTVWGSTKMGSRGTPDYMAPESWGSCSKYTPKVDVWSAGVIYFMMFTGKTPLHHLDVGAGPGEDVYAGEVANKSAAEGGAFPAYHRELDASLALVPRDDVRAAVRRML
eukprot:CAMPEP_0172201748 /NCGR_PEP_ID=MMETSP1050-20130122/30205_1 /TAXON_ID=233186 /ORGANISM="Cryptomonas curvata, Strain CCAP979/52" /LENGTH=735 /DNA_ID=CAMNT_0012879495 /DNA_START=41 /DNA_END=2245 /DNA_ORIENTATION=+